MRGGMVDRNVMRPVVDGAWFSWENQGFESVTTVLAGGGIRQRLGGEDASEAGVSGHSLSLEKHSRPPFLGVDSTVVGFRRDPQAA